MDEEELLKNTYKKTRRNTNTIPKPEFLSITK